MRIEQSRILQNSRFAGEYFLLVLASPHISRAVRPGQFIHLIVPRLEGCILRRPFSIFKAGKGTVSVLYKQVGKGTRALTSAGKGETVNIIGPLGNGFPAVSKGMLPVAVAGGYGVAPLNFLAQKMKIKGVAFIGGATSKDILCADNFRDLGWEVRITTDDGSRGMKGLVTAALEKWLAARKSAVNPEFFACGPDGMLKAVGKIAGKNGYRAWLSLDKHMGCGVGACLACVQEVKLPGGFVDRVRICREGPVFEAGEIIWKKH